MFLLSSLYEKETTQKKTNHHPHLDSTFVALFVCDFFYPFFFLLQKNKKCPPLANISGEAAEELFSVPTCCLTALPELRGKRWWVTKQLSRQPTHLLVIFLQRRVWQRRVVLLQIRWVQSQCPTDTIPRFSRRTGASGLCRATAAVVIGSQAACSQYAALKSNNLPRKCLGAREVIVTY